MILNKNVDKFIFLSKKSNNMVYPHICLTEHPFFSAAVYSYHRKEEERRYGYLAGMDPTICRKYMAKAKSYNIYVHLDGVIHGATDSNRYPHAAIHEILQQMADTVAQIILRDAPRGLDFRTRSSDWQPIEEWQDAQTSFKPLF